MALRNLKLLVSGGLDFTKGMDSIDKHVEQTSFRQCITFCETRQLKGWQPRFQPTVAKSSISTILHCFGGSCCMETWGQHRKMPQQMGVSQNKVCGTGSLSQGSVSRVCFVVCFGGLFRGSVSHSSSTSHS